MSAVRALALALVLAGCSYTAGLRAPEGSTTIGLELFSNPTDLRDLEAELYQSLSGALTRLCTTPLAAPDDADLVVRGRIVEYRRRGGVRSVVNRLQETGVLVSVEAWLEDRRTGRRVGLPAVSTKETGYIVGEGSADLSTLDETIRNPTLELLNERDARERTLRLVSEELVFELLAPRAASRDLGIEDPGR